MSTQALTVLFADLADSTRLYQMRGDASAHRAVSQSLHCMRDAIESHGGKLLRTVGDASLASFESTDAAYEAATRMQSDHVRTGLQLKVGFHYGEVIPDAGDVYGNAVNLAARVADYAEANEICITEQALSRLSLKHRVNVHYLDNVEFKGIEQPMPVYRVHWRSDSASTVLVASVPDAPRFTFELILALDTQLVHVDVDNPKVTLGRSADNDIVMESDSASRSHATIELIRGRFMLNDMSTNGTYLVRDGSLLEFLKRESVSLEQHGIIGLGFDPQTESNSVITYRLESKAD